MNGRGCQLVNAGVFAVIVLLSGHAAQAQSSRPEYTARVVLRLDFGTDPSQVYINWGPLSDRVSGPLADVEFTGGDSHKAYALTGFAVDAAGNVYVSGWQERHAVMKKFLPGFGRALAESLVMYTEPTDGGFFSSSVSPEGTIFAYDAGLHGGVSRYGPDGRRLWSRRAREVEDLFRKSAWGEEYAISAPGFGLHAIRGPYVICSLSASRGGGGTPIVHHRFGVVLDGDGNFVAVLPADRVAPDGRIYQGLPEYDDEGGVAEFPVCSYDPDGEIIEEIDLETELEGQPLFDNSPWAVGRCFIDAAGHVVVPYSGETVPDRFPYGLVLKAYTQRNFIRYDLEGRFLEKWSFPGSPFEDLLDSSIIGQDGNIYHLAFDDTGVDVVQYLPTFGYAARRGTSLQIKHLAAFRSNETLYTRLRDMASKSGADVAWHTKDSLAVVRRGATVLRLRPGSDMALDREGEAHSLGAPVELRDGRLWVPATRLAGLLELPLYTDDDQHVAYLITH